MEQQPASPLPAAEPEPLYFRAIAQPRASGCDGPTLESKGR